MIFPAVIAGLFAAALAGAIAGAVLALSARKPVADAPGDAVDASAETRVEDCIKAKGDETECVLAELRRAAGFK